ncbi:MAG: hypothetical protein ABI036_18745 [Fibrobacteria bacterium]
MIPKLRALGFAIAAFGLFACNQEDKLASPVAPSSNAEGTGSARLSLPAIPAGFLAKTSAGSNLLFTLTIAGQGMQPIQNTYRLNPGSQNTFTVTGIPAGYVRSFYGRLYAADSMSADTGRTDTSNIYEGRDSAYIERGGTAEVHLYLSRQNNGSAHVCVDVEGLPSDSTCSPPTRIVNFGGCWNLRIFKSGPISGGDSILTAKMRITQWDTSLVATITWPSGAADSSFGSVVNGEVAILGYTGGDFRFKAMMADSGGSRFQGEFSDTLRHISYTHMEGTAASCDTIWPPIDTSGPIDTLYPPTDTVQKACFTITEVLNNGTIASGRLGLTSSFGYYWGVFHWNGWGSAYTGWDVLQVSLLDTARLNLHMVALPNMFTGSRIDTVSYKIDIFPQANASGTVSVAVPATGRVLGTWKTVRAVCREDDLTF